MWVWKCLSRHVTYSEGILKVYVLSVVLQIKSSHLSLLILVYGRLKFPEVGTSSAALPHTLRFMIIRTTIAQQTESLPGLSFLWHWPLKDLQGRNGSCRAQVGFCIFPNLCSLFLEAGNLWAVLLCFWWSWFPVSSALFSSIILFGEMQSGLKMLVLGISAEGGQNAREQPRAQAFPGVNPHSCHLTDFL